ncbi:hypothetical protein BH23BAC4_BH23BAC4_11200 [soil metagenome]
MDFELLVPLVAILALFIGMPIVIFSGIARLKSMSSSGSELSSRELRDLIYEASFEAQAPLVQRIERLEALHADDPDLAARRSLPAARSEDDEVLDDLGDDDDSLALPPRSRGRN